MTLAALGVASYGQFFFNEKTRTEEFDVRPEYDRSGRTSVYKRFTIQLRTTIDSISGVGQEAAMQFAVRQLTQEGQQFQYTGHGSGPLQINVSPGSNDLVWGPKPQVLSCRLIAGDRAWELRWRVEFTKNTCLDADFFGRIMEFNYRLRYARDRAGYTTRTYAGYIRIPLTRASPGDGRLLDNADNYFEKVYPTVPLGFARETVDRELDESKTKLTFTVTDVEQPNPLPEGVVHSRFSDRRQAVTARIFSRWQGAWEAEYELVKGEPLDNALYHFLATCTDRKKEMKRLLPKGSLVFPYSMSIEEPDVHGRARGRFSLSYSVTAGSKTILLTAGLWRAVPGTSFTNWRKSLVDSGAWSAFGLNGMRFREGDDVIISLCDSAKPKPPPDREIGISTTIAFPPADVIPVDDPAPDESWVDWLCNLRLEEDTGTVEHKTLPGVGTVIPVGSTGITTTVGGLGGGRSTGGVQSNLSAGAGASAGPRPPQGTQGTSLKPQSQSQQQDFGRNYVQVRVIPSTWVVLHGFAIRAKYDIEPPKLLSVGGAAVVPDNRPDIEYFNTVTFGNYGVPMKAAVWSLRWRIGNAEGTAVPTKPVTAQGTAPTLPAVGQGGQQGVTMTGGGGNQQQGVLQGQRLTARRRPRLNGGF